MKSIVVPPKQIVLTNQVSDDTPYWHALREDLAVGIEPAPIVVFPAYDRSRRFYVVLDGNHRACACAKYGAIIRAFLLQSDLDRDALLDLELRDRIPKFPHRAFLAGERSLSEIKEQALQAASDLEYLTANCGLPPVAGARSSKRVQRQFQLKWRLGARTACLILKLGNRFSSTIQLSDGESITNTRSIMGLLCLSGQPGANIAVTVTGADAGDAMDALSEMLTCGERTDQCREPGCLGLPCLVSYTTDAIHYGCEHGHLWRTHRQKRALHL